VIFPRIYFLSLFSFSSFLLLFSPQLCCFFFSGLRLSVPGCFGRSGKSRPFDGPPRCASSACLEGPMRCGLLISIRGSKSRLEFETIPVVTGNPVGGALFLPIVLLFSPAFFYMRNLFPPADPLLYHPSAAGNHPRMSPPPPPSSGLKRFINLR